GGVFGLHARQVVFDGKGFPFEEVPPAIDAVPSGLVGAQDQAGERISRVGGAGHVPPRVGRVAGVDADRVAVDAPRGFAGGLLGGRTAVVAEDQLVGGQRDRLADRVGRDPFGQRGGGGFGGLVGRAIEDRLAELLDERVVGGPGAGGLL